MFDVLLAGEVGLKDETKVLPVDPGAQSGALYSEV